MSEEHRQLRAIRIWLGVFIAGLVLSGLTAFCLESEVRWLADGITWLGLSPTSALALWIGTVRDALIEVNRRFPFMAYGTDWLAFAHLVIAVAFIGPWRDPLKNAWVVDFGLICCAAVVPCALIAGALRGIPWWWRLLDCSFGVFGGYPAMHCKGPDPAAGDTNRGRVSTGH